MPAVILVHLLSVMMILYLRGMVHAMYWSTITNNNIPVDMWRIKLKSSRSIQIKILIINHYDYDYYIDIISNILSNVTWTANSLVLNVLINHGC